MATVLTNVGKAIIANRLAGLSAEPKYFGWGTGAGTAGVGDTGLSTPAPEARVAGTPSVETSNVPGDTYRVVGTIVASAARVITNVGLFDAVSGGSMFLKMDFAGVTLGIGDSLTFTLQYTAT